MEKLGDLIGPHGHMNRRSFLKLSGWLGLSATAVGIIPGKAEAVRFDKNMTKVTKTTLAMGTFVSMTLIHPSKDEAEEAMGRAFNEIDRLSGLLSRFDTATAVAVLNKEGQVKDLPEEVIQVVSRSLYYHKISGGSFDITVKPVVDLFRDRFDGESKRLPTEKEIEGLLKLVGSDKIELRDRSIHLMRPGMGITLDGIAKGFIVDKASQILDGHKIENHLINAGGDIRTKGSNGTSRGWTVAIQDPLKKNHYPDIIHMKDGAIATSGNYEVYYDREKMFHHIVDPRTGLSPRLTTSVSVAAKTTMEADALSTSVFVMNPSKGARFVDALSNCECLIIARDGILTRSKGWKSQAI